MRRSNGGRRSLMHAEPQAFPARGDATLRVAVNPRGLKPAAQGSRVGAIDPSCANLSADIAATRDLSMWIPEEIR